MGAIPISALRISIAAVILVLIVAISGRLPAALMAIRGHPIAIASIGAGVASYQALWFAAIPRVGASIATVLSLGLAPVLITGWESWQARSRPGLIRDALILIAVGTMSIRST